MTGKNIYILIRFGEDALIIMKLMKIITHVITKNYLENLQMN